MNVLAIAYRGTGKDTLHRMMNGQRAWGWKIYGCPNWKDLPLAPQGLVGPSPWKRVAFADELKHEVYAELKGSEQTSLTLAELEVRKDARCFGSPPFSSFRDLCIARGQMRRAQDPDYWCRLALFDKRDEHLVTTDCRFLGEVKYSQAWFTTVTVRLFRSEVPIPPYHPDGLEQDSEHNLDAYPTDYLLVTDEAEFPKAVAQFPQYADYVPVCDASAAHQAYPV